MGWMEARRRYVDGETVTAQKVEDLVARRVLRGLGLVERQLPIVERELIGEVKYDDATWPRTLTILRTMLRRKGLDFHVECYSTTPRHKEMLDRFAGINVQAALEPIVFMTRVLQTTQSLTYFAVAKTWHEVRQNSNQIKIEALAPPFRVLQNAFEDEAHWLCCQDTEQFVKQFGPYTFRLEEAT